MTSDIFGPSGSNSSELADPLSSSANKSAAPSLSALRQCKGCGETKPLSQFRPHNRDGRRWTCRTCENRWVRTTKPWTSETKRAYQRSVRLNRRGFVLTNDAKRRAKAKGIPFSLDWREVQAVIDRGVCQATGLPFNLAAPAKAWNAPSLDQIVPGAGYTKENTRVVLYAVNVMASTWGLQTILTVADALRARQ